MPIVARRKHLSNGPRFAVHYSNTGNQNGIIRRREQPVDSDDDSDFSFISDSDDSHDNDAELLNWWRMRNFVSRQYSRNFSATKFMLIALIVFVFSQVSIMIADLIDQLETKEYSQAQSPIRQNHSYQIDRPSDNTWFDSWKALGQGVKKKENIEDLHSHCKPTEWQTTHYVTCPTLHEYDLPQLLGDPYNHIGQGLWRSVWSISSFDKQEYAVMKIMRPEHDVNMRNFDRHKRDAIVMDMLTGNDNVVNAYGFCGNSVLTEFVGGDLSKLIEPKTQKTTLRSWKGVTDEENEDTERAMIYNATTIYKIDLSIDIAKGVAALHDLDGPVLHADIGPKQFLLDSKSNKVKINDFNRCRFLPIDTQNITNNKYCPVRIPTAPGKFRSPEEYRKRYLSEKIDIFSLGHVFFGILHGKRSTDSVIIRTNKLLFDGKANIGNLSPSEVLYANLIEKMFCLDPVDRPNAKDIVSELEQIKLKILNRDV